MHCEDRPQGCRSIAGCVSSWRTLVRSPGQTRGGPHDVLHLRGEPGVAFDTSTGASSPAVAQAYTYMDGPRTDVNDHTYLWHTESGLVRRSRDALGAETFIQYGAAFPALPTQVVGPSGQISRARYDSRGRVDSMTVVNPLGDGRDVLTRVSYDQPLSCLGHEQRITQDAPSPRKGPTGGPAVQARGFRARLPRHDRLRCIRRVERTDACERQN
jgi:hypothetical protein